MIRWTNRWCRVCACALLLLQGCKTKTAADVPTLVPFELLDAGEEPRAPLRYAIADGTTTTVTTTFTVTPEKEGTTTLSMSGLQSLEIKAILGPAQNRSDEIFYDYEIVNAKAVAAPRASREAREDIRQSAAFLKGAGATASSCNSKTPTSAPSTKPSPPPTPSPSNASPPPSKATTT